MVTAGLSERIVEQFKQIARTAHSEEDIRVGIEQVLSDTLKSFGVTRTASYERTTFSGGSADSVYGHVTIEYKKPGKLAESGSVKKIITQLTRYLVDFSKEAGGFGKQEEALEKMIGIGLDGERILFVRYSKSGRKRSSPLPKLPGLQISIFDHEDIADDSIRGGFQIIGPVQVSKESIDLLIIYLRSLSRKPLSPESLTDSLGPQSPTARNIVKSLFTALRNAEHMPRVITFFGEWKRIFGIVYGTEIDTSKIELQEFSSLYGISDIKSEELTLIFFAVHTYYALLMKFLAIEFASLQQGAFVTSIVSELITSDEKNTHQKLEFVENGFAFKNLGINNFLEGDFFSWYLDVWDESLNHAIHLLVNELHEFEPATSTLEPEYTRDLLKKLYQYLVPKSLRHDLGEYFTPDWLAERLLTQVGYKGDLDKRILDPSCGSGTFPILALKRLRQNAEDKLVEPRVLLNAALKNIVGFDLNPLSVIAARTNFLLALGDLLRYREAEIEIPIYLCDSVLTPVEETSLLGRNYSINTVVGEFILPGEIITSGQIPNLCYLLEFCVHNDFSDEQFINKVKTSLNFKLDQSLSTLKDIFNKFQKLEREGRNGIWARFIKNDFAPLLVGKFDYVVGNPPWVNWESLSNDYRKATNHLWVDYGLFTLKGHAARLGGGKKDLSMLFTYACADKYLVEKGKLGFVITQTVFQTKGAGDGFRRFKIGGNQNLRILVVDDMVDLQPFEGAINWTSVMVLQKGYSTKYPVPYTVWRKKKGAKISIENSLDFVKENTIREDFSASPIDKLNLTTPWQLTRSKDADLSKALGRSTYKARAGACTWLDGVYWLNIIDKRPDDLLVIENLPELGKQNIQKVQSVIEPTYVYPFLQWKSIKRFYAKSNFYILLVQDPNTRVGFDENELISTAPYTYAYLKIFEDDLRKRSGYRKYFDPENAPFYSMYNISNFTFSPYKVIWRTMGNSIDSVVLEEVDDRFLGRRCVIHKNTVYSVGLTDRDEAHYLSAVLNSSIVTKIATSYSVKGGKSFGIGIFDFIHIPKFNRLDNTHLELSKLSILAHEFSSSNKSTYDIEVEINSSAASLWSIDKEEFSKLRQMS